jgi:hypothetical protein
VSRTLFLVAAGTLLTFAVTHLIHHYVRLSESYGRLVLF